MVFNKFTIIVYTHLCRQQPSEKDFIFARQCPKGYFNSVMNECRERDGGHAHDDDWYDGFRATHNEVWYRIRKAEQQHKQEGKGTFTFFGHKATMNTSLRDLREKLDEDKERRREQKVIRESMEMKFMKEGKEMFHFYKEPEKPTDLREKLRKEEKDIEDKEMEEIERVCNEEVLLFEDDEMAQKQLSPAPAGSGEDDKEAYLKQEIENFKLQVKERKEQLKDKDNMALAKAKSIHKQTERARRIRKEQEARKTSSTYKVVSGEKASSSTSKVVSGEKSSSATNKVVSGEKTKRSRREDKQPIRRKAPTARHETEAEKDSSTKRRSLQAEKKRCQQASE